MQLVLEKLTKNYSNKIAVDRISLNLSEGVYGLLGSNGAGKTTLMRMICGILKPTFGEVKVDGQNNIEMGELFRDLIGYLPQNFGYYPDFKAIEYLEYIAALKGLPSAIAKKKSLELLETVGLNEVAGKKIKTFSGGMKQRLGIAQAVINDPKILILDEPTAGLDPKERVRFRNIISNFSKDKIVLLSTHIVSDIEYIADKIMIMKNGTFILHGTVEELLKVVKTKVWKYIVTDSDASDAEHILKNYCISNVHHYGNYTEYRIVSDQKPFEDAVSQEPTLEDLFLYCFQDINSATGKQEVLCLL